MGYTEIHVEDLHNIQLAKLFEGETDIQKVCLDSLDFGEFGENIVSSKTPEELTLKINRIVLYREEYSEPLKTFCIEEDGGHIVVTEQKPVEQEQEEYSYVWTCHNENFFMEGHSLFHLYMTAQYNIFKHSYFHTYPISLCKMSDINLLYMPPNSHLELLINNSEKLMYPNN